MFWESNYKTFQKRLWDISLKKESDELESAREYREQRASQSKSDSELYFKTSMEELKRELEDLKKEKLLKIELQYIRKRHLLIKKYTYKIKHLLKEELAKEFNSLGISFIRQISDTFNTGEITLPKDLESVPPKKFTVRNTIEQKILFSHENKYIEFTTDSILGEYEPMIREKITKILGE